MIKHLLNTMRAQAELALNSRAVTRIGIVKSVDTNNYCAKVNIQPEDVETGWLPILSPWVGNNWGMFCPPSAGDLVEVQFQDADYEAGLICGRLFNDSARPLNAQCGEFWIVHQSGSLLKFTNDGKVALTAHSDLNVNVGGDLNATVSGKLVANVTGDTNLTVSGNINSSATNFNHTGPVKITGTLEVTQAITGDTTITGVTDVIGGGKSLKTHTHSGVTTGGGVTGPPV